MKKMILLLVLGCFLGTLNAQKIKVTWGEKENKAKEPCPSRLLGSFGDLTYVFNSMLPLRVSSCNISVLNSDKLTKIKTIDFKEVFPKAEHNDNIDEVILHRDKIVVFRNVEEDFYMTILDLNGKVLLNKKHLQKINKDDPLQRIEVVKYTPDSSKIVIVRKTADYNYKTSRTLFLFNADLELLNTGKVVLNFDIDKVREDVEEKNHGYYIYNSGDVLIWASAYVYNNKIISTVSSVRSRLCHYSLSNAKPELKNIDFNPDKHIISSMKVMVNEKTINIYGAYLTELKYYNNTMLTGLITISLGAESLNVISKKLLPFDRKIKTRNPFDVVAEGVSWKFNISKVIEIANGEKYCAFEYNESLLQRDSKYEYIRTNSKDLLIIKLNNENEIIWTEVVPKNQITSAAVSPAASLTLFKYADGHMMTEAYIKAFKAAKTFVNETGYYLFISDKKMFVLFNDHDKNIGKKSADKKLNFVNGFNKLYCALVTLDLETGKWSKKALFNYKETKMSFSPGNTTPLSNDQIFLFSIDKNGASMPGKLIIQ